MHFLMSQVKAGVGSLFVASSGKKSIITFHHIVIQVLDFCISPWLCIRAFENEDCDGVFSSNQVISDCACFYWLIYDLWLISDSRRCYEMIGC